MNAFFFGVETVFRTGLNTRDFGMDGFTGLGARENPEFGGKEFLMTGSYWAKPAPVTPVQTRTNPQKMNRFMGLA
jgi:hypothetical protein